MHAHEHHLPVYLGIIYSISALLVLTLFPRHPRKILEIGQLTLLEAAADLGSPPVAGLPGCHRAAVPIPGVISRIHARVHVLHSGPVASLSFSPSLVALGGPPDI